MLPSRTPINFVDAPTCAMPATNTIRTFANNGDFSALLSVCKLLPPTLIWLEEYGLGYYPIHDLPYDENYFQKYVGYADTAMGRALTKARVDLVEAWAPEWTVLDVGIGCGAFVEAMDDRCFGYDINPAAVRWLQLHGKWWDMYTGLTDHACFWDSLEHIEDIPKALNTVTETVFVSLPIFEGMEHARHSKHFRTDEHCWYFTATGLLTYLRTLGWKCVERNWMETDLGREDIETYVFKRVE